MTSSARLGFRTYTTRIPGVMWRGAIRQVAREFGHLFGKLPEDHRRVRELVVRELPRAGGPIAPEEIAERLGMSRARVVDVLDDLERWLSYLVRDADGRVSWAFPVTVEPTPHVVELGGRVRIHAA